MIPAWLGRRCAGIPERVACKFSEKAIMLAKAALMGDAETFQLIAKAEHASECKKLGRAVHPFDQELWNEHIEEVAFEVVRQKFEADASIRKVLLSTGEIVLAEAAPNDRIWGVGLKLGDPRLQDEQTWQGQNVLGKALMKARAHIRDSKEGGTMASVAPASDLAAAPPAEEAAAESISVTILSM